MNIILHGEGQEKMMHHCETDAFQYKIIVPVKLFNPPVNKWIPLAYIEKELIYEFKYHDGKYYHYQLT
jgi:hypothetical protein